MALATTTGAITAEGHDLTNKGPSKTQKSFFFFGIFVLYDTPFSRNGLIPSDHGAGRRVKGGRGRAMENLFCITLCTTSMAMAPITIGTEDTRSNHTWNQTETVYGRRGHAVRYRTGYRRTHNTTQLNRTIIPLLCITITDFKQDTALFAALVRLLLKKNSIFRYILTSTPPRRQCLSRTRRGSSMVGITRSSQTKRVVQAVPTADRIDILHIQRYA